MLVTKLISLALSIACFIGEIHLVPPAWKSCYKCSDLCVVGVRDRKVGVVPSFLHPLNRELKSGNPTEHVSIAAVQVHELLEAVEEDIGRALNKEGPQETLEVPDSVVRILQKISVEEPFCGLLLLLPNGSATLVHACHCLAQ